MLINIGPAQKDNLRLVNYRKIKKYKVAFLLIFLLLPPLVFLCFLWNPMKWDVLKSNAKLEKNIINAVAKVELADGTGSAFLVSNNYAITACHVVTDLSINDTLNLNFEKAKKNKIKAKVVYKGDLEQMDDYAVLQLLEAVDIEPIEIGSVQDIKIKTQVNVIGFPGGMFSSTFGTITNDEVKDYPKLIQLDAGAWPGSSGGPIVIDGKNQVIGILISGLEGEYKGIVWGVKINGLLNDPKFQSTGIKF